MELLLLLLLAPRKLAVISLVEIDLSRRRRRRPPPRAREAYGATVWVAACRALSASGPGSSVEALLLLPLVLQSGGQDDAGNPLID